jgi:hypothetical protein
MIHKVFGAIGVLLGGAILLNWMISGSPASVSSAYQTGRTVGLVFGVLLLVSGAYSLFKKSA